MYAQQVILHNYGPIERLDLEFPFSGDLPKPVVFVGENGSGKSILLSHIVNGLLSAKSVAYPETPEVDPFKVYKLRSGLYITSDRDYYFAQVSFEDGHFVSELRARTAKDDYAAVPIGIRGTVADELWNAMQGTDFESYKSSFVRDNPLNPGSISTKALRKFADNCILYFPPDRFEEPAWLNERHLTARAQLTVAEHMAGHTVRKVIAKSPLLENQNWLFDVIYDRAAFEIRTTNMNLPLENSNTSIPLPIFAGYGGDATETFQAAIQITRAITQAPDVQFNIGKRGNRAVGLELAEGTMVPNIFQLSSGEVSLLNLFLSVLRDFDMCDVPFSGVNDIRGIVVVDEIDLHLHASHQYEILPKLIRMFPKVQFIITTHSPLFVLGMEDQFGAEGFALYRLPRGEQIEPEEFSEFSQAYQSFAKTRRFWDHMHEMLEGARKPVVFLEGKTDEAYLQKAAELFGKEGVLAGLDLRDGGGKGNLDKIWKNLKPPLTDIVQQQVMLLYDADTNKTPEDRGKILKRVVHAHPENPIATGIENLFGRETLERALSYRKDFIDVVDAHSRQVGGRKENVPEVWGVNADQKTNLCNWLCDNGTPEDFKGFHGVFELLEELEYATTNS